MAYTINKTDGTIVATVADGQIDQLSTDLTLIGKNYSGFGEALNENFIKILENFASTTRPTKPIRGQIWFDVNELKLKVYSGSEFQPVSSATISSTRPSTLGVGDLWFNDVDRQLYFFDGTNIVLLGPDYSVSQGLSGLKVVSLLDNQNQTRVVTLLYTNGILIGLFSKDTFNIKIALDGYGPAGASVIPGFNKGNLANLKFNVTVTNSESLGNEPASGYALLRTSNNFQGQIKIISNLGVIIGNADQLTLRVTDSGDVQLSNSASDKNLILSARRGDDQESALVIAPITRKIEMYPGFTNSEVNIGGNLIVNGDLTVEGTTTTINTSTMTVEDKNIELAKVSSPTNALADGGGITLKGTEDHTLNWTVASRAWNSSEHVNLVSSTSVATPTYKINGVALFEQTVFTPGSERFRLTTAVNSIPGVDAFGKQTVITVGPGLISDTPYLRIENKRISTVQSNFDIELAPDGTGNVVLIGSPKITGMADPTAAQDAATKEYVDRIAESRPLVFSIDLTDGKSNSYIISQILNNIAPPALYRDETRAKILCSIINPSSSTLNIDPLVNLTTTTVSTPSGTVGAVTNVAISPATVSPPSISITRIVKTFKIENGIWVYVSPDVNLAP